MTIDKTEPKTCYICGGSLKDFSWLNLCLECVIKVFEGCSKVEKPDSEASQDD